MLRDSRFSTLRVESGDWVVMADDDRVVAYSSHGNGAELIAALMNGDLTSLGNASAETLAHCYSAIQGALRVLRPRGRPAVGQEALPQI
jgi:hypothetical protein